SSSLIPSEEALNAFWRRLQKKRNAFQAPVAIHTTHTNPMVFERQKRVRMRFNAFLCFQQGLTEASS
ncbi:hypothetical protein, partial [Escherichia coli]|uniref:hypothetical protein n=1 Tax=Escherichia coli TaxID=562 RepID=UPI001BC852F9